MMKFVVRESEYIYIFLYAICYFFVYHLAGANMCPLSRPTNPCSHCDISRAANIIQKKTKLFVLYFFF